MKLLGTGYVSSPNIGVSIPRESLYANPDGFHKKLIDLGLSLDALCDIAIQMHMTKFSLGFPVKKGTEEGFIKYEDIAKTFFDPALKKYNEEKKNTLPIPYRNKDGFINQRRLKKFTFGVTRTTFNTTKFDAILGKVIEQTKWYAILKDDVTPGDLIKLFFRSETLTKADIVTLNTQSIYEKIKKHSEGFKNPVGWIQSWLDRNFEAIKENKLYEDVSSLPVLGLRTWAIKVNYERETDGNFGITYGKSDSNFTKSWKICDLKELKATLVEMKKIKSDATDEDVKKEVNNPTKTKNKK